jgi:outer membrane protein TolC
MLAREPDAPLALGPELPPARPLPADDAAILGVGVHANPHLSSLLVQVAGREVALELARLMYWPNVNPFAAFTGDVSQTLGVAVMLPTTLPEIRGGIAEARAQLAGARAAARQAHQDHTAHFVATLAVLRQAEREAELFEHEILPAAQLLADTTRQSYAAGSADLLELVSTQRTLLDVRLVVAEARIERERRAVEIEEHAGIDLETLQGEEVRP